MIEKCVDAWCKNLQENMVIDIPHGTWSIDSKDQQINTKMAVFVFHRRKEINEEIMKILHF